MDTNSKNLMKIAIYVSVFIIAIVIVLIDDIVGVKSTSKEKVEMLDNSFIDEIKGIEDNNYSVDAFVYSDDDAATLNLQKNGEVVLSSLKYHGDEKEYIEYNNSYYEIKDNELAKSYDFDGFPFDKTFLYLSNIKKLFDTDYSLKEVNEELLVTYNIKSVLNVYNYFNGTSVLPNDDVVTLRLYRENDADYIEMDFTSLYNLIYKKDYKRIIYIMTFKSIKQEDMSWLIDKIS